MGEVIQLPAAKPIIPKSLRRTYKRHHFLVTFIPAEKKWRWTVEVVTKTQLSAVEDTQVKAIRAAEKCIDRII